MKKKLSTENIFIALVALVVVISVFNIAVLYSANAILSERIKTQQEEARPARLQVTSIVDSSCTDCFNIATITALLKNEDVNITEEKTLEAKSDEAQGLIKKYRIQKIPTLLVHGEINKTGARTFLDRYGEYRENFEAALITNYDPPYYDIESGKFVGRVKITHLSDASCKNCTSLKPLTDAFRSAKVEIAEEKSVEYNSAEGNELIIKFGVQHIPAVIISKDITEYAAFRNMPQQLNTTEKEGFYALHATAPPYRLLKENRIIGLVDITNIVDKSCAKCSNMTVALVLKQSGVFVNSEKTVDYNSSEGKELAQGYGITALPSMLVSKDVDDYSNLQQYWSRVNKTLKNSTYVLPADRPPYTDLKSGRLLGAVKVVYLSDSSCSSCYIVTNHRVPLRSFGVYVENETFVDANSDEGKALTDKYKITKVPTILLSPEADIYRDLKSVWTGQSVGIIASDGWYVFTATELMGTYKDLSSGQLISPQ